MLNKTKIRLCSALLSVSLMLPLSVGAAAIEPQAKIGDTYYDSLWQALDTVQDGQTIEVLTDISNQEVVLSRHCNEPFSITIDLNGHNIWESTDNSPAFTYLSADGTVAPSVTLKNGSISSTSQPTAGSPYASGIWMESLDQQCLPILILQNMSISAQNDAAINCINAQLQVVSADITGKDDAVYAQNAPVYIQAGHFSILSDTDYGKDGALAVQGSATVEMTATDPVVSPADWQTQASASISVIKFADVSEWDWYASDVNALVKRGVVNGINCWTFEPARNVTRAEFVTMLAKAAGADTTQYNASWSFGDINAGDWYSGSVGWAVENGIASGYGYKLFGPNDVITREQMAVMLYHFQQNILNKAVTDKVTPGVFPDAETVSTWAQEAIDVMVREGIISGAQADGVVYLMPQNNASRAQASVMLNNMLNL
ncbi:MAG: S-layer homology domain-containing protein [Eubacteriales bacterium]|nr:S-layer homology domain-containing protein [Eubacteriales bacterium]